MEEDRPFFRRFPIRHFFCRIEILNSTLFFDKKSVDKKSSDFCLDFQIRKNTQIRLFSNQKSNNSAAEGGPEEKIAYYGAKHNFST